LEFNKATLFLEIAILQWKKSKEREKKEEEEEKN
jgi:hypothetical protein